MYHNLLCSSDVLASKPVHRTGIQCKCTCLHAFSQESLPVRWSVAHPAAAATRRPF